MLSRKSRTMKKAFTFLALLVACCGSLLWFGVTRNRNIIRFHDEASARAEVLKHIPIGSDIRQAENVLERSGFERQLAVGEKYRFDLKKPNIFQRVEKFAKNPELRAVQTVHAWCGLPVSCWSVTIGYKNLRVMHVYVRNALAGFNL